MSRNLPFTVRNGTWYVDYHHRGKRVRYTLGVPDSTPLRQVWQIFERLERLRDGEHNQRTDRSEALLAERREVMRANREALALERNIKAKREVISNLREVISNLEVRQVTRAPKRTKSKHSGGTARKPPIRKSISTSLRFKVFQHYGFKCVYCGKTPPQSELQIDHIIPVSRGGTNTRENLVAACAECNHGKRDRLINWRLNEDVFLKEVST